MVVSARRAQATGTAAFLIGRVLDSDTAHMSSNSKMPFATAWQTALARKSTLIQGMQAGKKGRQLAF